MKHLQQIQTRCWIAQLQTSALGEGEIPISSESLAEYQFLSTIFCKKVRPSNNEKLHKVSTSEIFTYELHAADTYVALNIPKYSRSQTSTDAAYAAKSLIGN